LRNSYIYITYQYINMQNVHSTVYIHIYIHICMYIYILIPPKNGEIELWPDRHVVKCKHMFHNCQTITITRASGTVVQYFRHFSYCSPGLSYSRLISMYRVLSVIVDSLPNSKMLGTRLWTARVRFLYSWTAHWWNGYD